MRKQGTWSCWTHSRDWHTSHAKGQHVEPATTLVYQCTNRRWPNIRLLWEPPPATIHWSCTCMPMQNSHKWLRSSLRQLSPERPNQQMRKGQNMRPTIWVQVLLTRRCTPWLWSPLKKFFSQLCSERIYGFLSPIQLNRLISSLSKRLWVASATRSVHKGHLYGSESTVWVKGFRLAIWQWTKREKNMSCCFMQIRIFLLLITCSDFTPSSVRWTRSHWRALYLLLT